MPKYSSNEFLYARPLAHAILSDRRFRQWFLVGTKLADRALDARPQPEEQAKLRTTENSRKWFWFNYWCPKDRRCECREEKGIETDILLVFEAPDRLRFAVHVEVKPPDEGLQPGQAESYPRRGRCWATPATRPRTVLAHDDFVTIVVCGENLKSDSRLSNFDKVVLHRDIEQRISMYPDLTDLRYLWRVERTAAKKYASMHPS
jgi:hypothetical protein